MFDLHEADLLVSMRIHESCGKGITSRITKTFEFLMEYNSEDLWFVCTDGLFDSPHTWSFTDD